MRTGSMAAVALCGALALSGCAGFWDPPASSTTTTTTTTLSSGYFFVLDQASAQVLSYNIVSGTLTLVGTIAVPSAPLSITVAPNNAFLYVGTANGIYLYTISSGVLTLSGSLPIYSDPATAMQVDSTDTWLVEASGSGNLNAIPISSTTGQIPSAAATCSNSTVICTVALTGATVHQLAISPNNLYVFVAAGTDGTSAFGFTAGNANPFGSKAYATVPVVTASGGAALSVAVDTSNRLVYLGEAAAVSSSGGGLRVFTLGSAGALTELATSPYASGGTGPYGILPKTTGDYVYVSNWNGTSAGNVTGFQITDTSGTYALVKLSATVSTGAEPRGLIEDSAKNFIIAAGAAGTPYLSASFFDTTTAGKLDLSITSSTYSAYALAAEH